MNAEHIWAGVAVVGTWLWKNIGQVVAEAVASAEKHNVIADGKFTHEELEEIAVDVAKARLRVVPEFVIRAIIRRVCRRRKHARL